VFVPGNPFQPSLMFTGNARVYVSGAPESGAPLYGRFMASPTNIRLGWKGLPGTNTLAYYENLLFFIFSSILPLSYKEQDLSDLLLLVEENV
jgi:hypothetical protein